jgi:hypothetical protein
MCDPAIGIVGSTWTWKKVGYLPIGEGLLQCWYRFCPRIDSFFYRVILVGRDRDPVACDTEQPERIIWFVALEGHGEEVGIGNVFCLALLSCWEIINFFMPEKIYPPSTS